MILSTHASPHLLLIRNFYHFLPPLPLVLVSIVFTPVVTIRCIALPKHRLKYCTCHDSSASFVKDIFLVRRQRLCPQNIRGWPSLIAMILGIPCILTVLSTNDRKYVFWILGFYASEIIGRLAVVALGVVAKLSRLLSSAKP
jgi:hypothetical protein